MALSINGMESKDDRISLAEAVCRIYAKPSQRIDVRCAGDLGKITVSGNTVIDAEGKKTAEIVGLITEKVAQDITIVMMDYSENDTKELHESHCDVNTERKLVETAVRELFREVSVEYDPLGWRPSDSYREDSKS
uniref:Uncharacterized protein n=1 Tax=Candidatus Kentrum sp. UNK TaxID=2126344 RepID=A0A451AYF6_9GAMM|nr:MAG: hypothetical protein BECKUNK1418G_GA0071005_11265 [Candidatus Kentron sp. UNK]VFK71085.1 MAG: hypothetical protein BECKUNK1418H_GA0071006_10505 [Candidatus Kentron sp. UNK]